MRKTLFIIPLLLFLGCSSKNQIQKNLKAITIHSKLVKAVKENNFDKADDLFLTMEAEHPTSIYIKQDLLILYLGHLNYGDFKLAKFYLNQYETRYASKDEIPWCEYQKIKVDFLSYHNAYTNQKKILDLIKECKNYKLSYPNSQFLPEVNTIYMKAYLTNLYLDDKISKLYKKEGKIKASKEYKVKVPKNSVPPQVPWYKKIFYW
ncbi:outer membrane protein assembly factor BamD [Caminibacter sp.]